MSPADQQVRERALDVTRSFIVQAPAGSGKTELLVQRYLALLALVRRPESVLAITFTRKAAAEMRRRVLEALERAASPPPPAPHEARTWELARAARQQACRESWRLAENPHRLEIRTIDSFCASLAGRMPCSSRLGASPAIVEDARELYQAAARATIAQLESDEWAEPLSRLLLHLDNDAAALERLIVAMLARRDQWLRHLGAGQDQLQASLEKLTREKLAAVRAVAPPWLAPALHLRQLPGNEPGDLACWKEIAGRLLTAGGAWRKAKLKSHPELEDCPAFKAALEEVQRLPELAVVEDNEWQIVQDAVTVLKLATTQLKLQFRARAQADYIEIAEAASRALGNQDVAGELLEALDARIEHILMDEFQDTSLTQFRLLEQLVAGWAPGDGRTLFLVGDPMQSIYRFREAEVGLFLKAVREGVGPVRLEPLQLSVNFRSDRKLIQWVNETFRQVLPSYDDITCGAVRFRASEPRPGAAEGLPAHVHPFIGKRQDEAEAARVIQIIRDVHRRDSSARVAVLVRSRSHLPAILRALDKEGLRYRAVEIDSLAEVSVVEDLLALTRALLDRADRVAWLALLRAPWCGLTLGDLCLLVGDDQRRVVWDLIWDEDRLGRLPEEAQGRLRRVRQALDECFKYRPSSLRAWVESAWIALGGPACVEGRADLDNAEAYFELLDKLDEGGDLNTETLQAQVEALWAQPDPEAPETLQVMTIHKAKGLEFDVVIVPGLGRWQRSDEPRLLAWMELPGQSSEGELLLAPVAAKGGRPSPLGEYLKWLDKQKADYEAARLLYVAATRARHELHLVGTAPLTGAGDLKPDGRSLLAKLWPAVKDEFERAAQQASPVEASNAIAPPPTELRRLVAGWQPPVTWLALETAHRPGPSEHLPRAVFPQAAPRLRHVGTVVHRMLHRIAREGLARWDAARVRGLHAVFEAALRDLGVAAEELASAAAEVERALIQTLEDPRGRWLLDDTHQLAASEYALSGMVEGRLVNVRLDRTFVDEHGVRWIVDFKASRHEGGSLDEFLAAEVERYRDQLELYATLMRGLDEREIRLGVYFPLIPAWRELGAPERVAV